MLAELRVENFALIDQICLRLGAGFNAFTGETGAGKSIVVDAMEAVLGGRVSSDLIRQGAERAVVEAVFDIEGLSPVRAGLEELGLGQAGDSTLVITREISSNGRSVMRLNHRVVNASTAREITRLLVDLHGQHEHQALLDPDRPLEVLDGYGGREAAGLAAWVDRLWRERRECEKEIDSLSAGMRDRARQVDLLNHQKSEIDAAAPSPGEDQKLEDERRVLTQFEKLILGIETTYLLLYGGQDGPAATGLLSRARDELGRLVPIDPRLSGLKQSLEEALIQVREAARELASYRDRLEADPARLREIEDRLAQINNLKRKYGPGIEEVLSFRDEIAADLSRLENSDQRLQELEQRYAGLSRELLTAAGALSEARGRAAGVLSEAVTQELQQLNLPGATLEFRLEPREDGEITARGADRCQLLFSANRGESPRPLGRVVSGGELSRVMLGLKTVLAGLDQAGTLIFDEIDTGLGGRTAVAVGEKMAGLSSARQVIAVTHLPQIAAMADHHFRVQKTEQGGRTLVRVAELSEDDRCAELARMMGGEDLSPLAKDHARDLIRQGRAIRGRSV